MDIDVEFALKGITNSIETNHIAPNITESQFLKCNKYSELNLLIALKIRYNMMIFFPGVIKVVA